MTVKINEIWIDENATSMSDLLATLDQCNERFVNTWSSHYKYRQNKTQRDGIQL